MIVHVWRRAVEADVGPVVVACAEAGIAEAVGAAGASGSSAGINKSPTMMLTHTSNNAISTEAPSLWRNENFIKRYPFTPRNRPGRPYTVGDVAALGVPAGTDFASTSRPVQSASR